VIGQIKYMGGNPYMEVNNKGTLERLAAMRALAEIWLCIRTQFRPTTIGWIRDYVRKHHR